MIWSGVAHRSTTERVGCYGPSWKKQSGPIVPAGNVRLRSSEKNFKKSAAGLSQAQARSGLSFQTICEFLGIDPGQLLERLKSLDDGEFPRRRYRPQRNGRPRILSA